MGKLGGRRGDIYTNGAPGFLPVDFFNGGYYVGDLRGSEFIGGSGGEPFSKSIFFCFCVCRVPFVYWLADVFTWQT